MIRLAKPADAEGTVNCGRILTQVKRQVKAHYFTVPR